MVQICLLQLCHAVMSCQVMMPLLLCNFSPILSFADTILSNQLILGLPMLFDPLRSFDTIKPTLLHL